MKRNRIKIVYHQESRQSTFFYENEAGEWTAVPADSELSRNSFTHGDLKEKIPQVLQFINENYNLAARGVDIIFDGPEEIRKAISSCIEISYGGRNIICNHNRMVIVAGQMGAGKSTLVEALCDFSGCQYSQNRDVGHTRYVDASHSVMFLEVDGIERGQENWEHARQAIYSLGKAGATHLIYCICRGYNRIEFKEYELLTTFSQEFPKIKILIALTEYLEEDSSSFINGIRKYFPFAEIYPVLAKDKKMRGWGVISAYGIDEIAKGIF